MATVDRALWWLIASFVIGWAFLTFLGPVAGEPSWDWQTYAGAVGIGAILLTAYWLIRKTGFLE